MWILVSCLFFMLLIACAFLIDTPARKTPIFPLIILLIGAPVLYGQSEQSKAWFSYTKDKALNKTLLNHPLPDINTVIQQLKTHLSENPNSAQGWYLLGRLYASQQQFSAAADAFAKADNLTPHKTVIEFNYAEALFMQQNKALLPKVEALLQEILKHAPTQDAAANLLALTFYEQGKYNDAITLWENLSERYPPDTRDGKAILAAIAKAQQKLSENSLQQ